MGFHNLRQQIIITLVVPKSINAIEIGKTLWKLIKSCGHMIGAFVGKCRFWLCVLWIPGGCMPFCDNREYGRKTQYISIEAPEC